jgi:hypothetical protein
MTANEEQRDFARRIRELGRSRAVQQRRAESITALRGGFLKGLTYLWLVPAFYFVFVLTRLLLNHSVLPPSPWHIAAFALVPPVLLSIYLYLKSCLKEIDPERALSSLDEMLHNKDRLRTAHQFLRLPSLSAFEAAAIEDAQTSLPLAEACKPPVAASVPFRLRGATLSLFFALLLLLGALWLSGLASRNTEGVTPTPPAVVAQSPDNGPEPKDATSPENPGKETTPNTTNPREAAPKSPREPRTHKPSSVPSPVLVGEKESKGRTQTGESAQATSSSGAGDARGTSSQEPQKSLSPSKPTEPKKKPKSKEKPDTPPAPDKRAEEDSGSTSGRGAASGSNRSPAASPWPSKDQVTSEDEEALEDDEDVDDEFDNSEARGGVQPGLRDRKPPVNRDLTIGFGNAKNPDANGRGGPGEHKKSRGVASLVLGSPIPDHIKGRPNPGKTKITQERVQPESEDAAPFESSARSPREAPFGTLDKPDLSPWMRDLVRAYYLSIRRSN